MSVRNQIRISQELWFGRNGDMPVREGRRLAWIDQALAPAATRLPETTLAALRNALAAVIGVEPVVSLRDVCGLSAQATEDSLAWTARTIVTAVLAPPDSGRGGSPGPRRRTWATSSRSSATG